MRQLDLTGQVYNDLTVLHRAENSNGRTAWLCRCVCGNETVVRTTNIRTEQVKSCGCKQSVPVDLSGRIIGRWTVLYQTNHRVAGSVMWMCLCDCGTKREVASANLSANRTLSCGCLNVEMMSNRRGKAHPSYNPDISDEDRDNRRWSVEYQEWRKAIFKRDNYTCQCCNQSKSGHLNAHHILGYATHPQYRYLLQNGITLCDTCHTEFHQTYGYVWFTHDNLETFIEEKQL